YTSIIFGNNVEAYGGLLHPSGFLISVRGTESYYGGNIGGGADIYVDFRTWHSYVALTVEGGTAPLSVLNRHLGPVTVITFGPVFGAAGPSDLEQGSTSAVYPLSLFKLSVVSALAEGTKNSVFGIVRQLAKRDLNVSLSDKIVITGVS